jgi:hypothetical protein
MDRKYLFVPFEEKELAKSHGAKWDKERKKWFVEGEVPEALEKYVKSQGPEMGGQLWEECERCGREPVYLPLLLCERCWPKNNY